VSEQWRPGIAYPPGDPRWPHNQPLASRLFVNGARTVLVTCWSNGEVEVAFREHPGATWGPPVRVVEDTA
jgi:hypothetical protein